MVSCSILRSTFYFGYGLLPFIYDLAIFTYELYGWNSKGNSFLSHYILLINTIGGSSNSLILVKNYVHVSLGSITGSSIVTNMIEIYLYFLALFYNLKHFRAKHPYLINPKIKNNSRK